MDCYELAKPVFIDRVLFNINSVDISQYRYNRKKSIFVILLIFTGQIKYLLNLTDNINDG